MIILFDHRAKRNAFTLVELLVVIAILGLLSTVALVATNSARVKSRNTKRIADVRQLAQAFSLAYNESGSYPASGGPVCLSTSCTGAWSSFGTSTTVDNFIAPYIPSKLTDPIDSARPYGGYVYNGPWAGGTSGFDGSIFLPDYHLAYNLEGVYSCAPGRIWLQNATRTECILPLPS